jgi:hypothetical protein
MRAGYIVMQNDTIRGLVQYNESKAAALSCVFEKDGVRTKYSPLEITAFSFEQRKFVSAVIDSVRQFAELIADGPAQLLRVSSIFHIRKGDKVVSMKPIEKNYYMDGQDYRREDRTFAGLLTILLNDCEKKELIQRKIGRIHPTRDQDEKSYVDLVRTYNACVDGTTETTRVKKASISMGGYISINNTRADVRSNDPYGGKGIFADYEFESSPHVAAAFFFDVSNPRISEKLHIQIEAAYTRTKFDGANTRVTTGPPGQTTQPTYHVDYSSVRIPVSIRYNFLTTSLAPYLRVGCAFNFMSGDFTRRQYLTDGTIYEGEYLLMSEFAAPVFGGIGIEKNLKKCILLIEGRYALGPELLDKYQLFSFTASSIEVMAGIRFALR